METIVIVSRKKAPDLRLLASVRTLFPESEIHVVLGDTGKYSESEERFCLPRLNKRMQKAWTWPISSW